MTDVDEHLLTASKLREAADGDDELLLEHVGRLDRADDRGAIAFCEQHLGDVWRDSELREDVLGQLHSEAVDLALERGDMGAVAAALGIEKTDLEGSQLRLAARLLDELERDGALTTVLAAGDPNTGKTNSAWLLVEAARVLWDDLLVISNSDAAAVDVRVTSSRDLAIALLEHRDRPKVVLVDEGSTHFDARTHSYEVADQWSPLHKHMSKLGVEICTVIGHTGKDVAPEHKRLVSLALWKAEPELAEFYERWPADSDRPADQLFGGDVSALEATSVEYEPDEPAPWEWNLDTAPFGTDLDWPELIEEIEATPPVE